MKDRELTKCEVVNELRTYTALVSDEWQEATDILCSAVRYDWLYSDEFAAALEKELRDSLQYCRENATIVEEEITETYTRKSIDWE